MVVDLQAVLVLDLVDLRPTLIRARRAVRAAPARTAARARRRRPRGAPGGGGMSVGGHGGSLTAVAWRCAWSGPMHAPGEAGAGRAEERRARSRDPRNAE